MSDKLQALNAAVKDAAAAEKVAFVAAASANVASKASVAKANSALIVYKKAVKAAQKAFDSYADAAAYAAAAKAKTAKKSAAVKKFVVLAKKYVLKNTKNNQIKAMTLKNILKNINTDRSEEWIDYDESDWKEGLLQFTEYIVL